MSGTYATNPRDWDKAVVTKLIQNRQIAPFYRGLQDELEGLSEANEDAFAESPPKHASNQSEIDAKHEEIERLLQDVGVRPGQESFDDQGRIGMRARESAPHRRAEIEMYERGTLECPICMMCAHLPLYFEKK